MIFVHSAVPSWVITGQWLEQVEHPFGHPTPRFQEGKCLSVGGVSLLVQAFYMRGQS